MDAESDGQTSRAQRDGLVGKSRKCQGLGCVKLFTPPPGPGNWLYCSDACKNSKKGSPVPSNKRGSSVLSPNDPVAKLSRDEYFEAVFDCSIDSFRALSKEDMLLQCKGAFGKLDDVDQLRSDNADLLRQLSVMKKELSTAKLIIADQEIKLRMLTESQPPPAKSRSEKQATPTFASVARAAAKPVLVARVNKDTQKISDAKIDELLGLQGDGPIVQQIRNGDDKIVLSFKDIVARDKAKQLLSNAKEDEKVLFASVFAPSKSFPALVRFHDLEGVKMYKGVEFAKERAEQQAMLIAKLESCNSSLVGQIHSVRLLFNHKDTKSFLARVAFNSRAIRDQVLDKGRVLISENRSQAVASVDPAKEVKQCTRCLRFGHLTSACKAKFEECGKCAENHATQTCQATPERYRCRNCSKQHSATSLRCPALAAAINQFIKYDSSD